TQVFRDVVLRMLRRYYDRLVDLLFPHDYPSVHYCRLVRLQEFIPLRTRDERGGGQVANDIQRRATHVENAIDTQNNRNQGWVHTDSDQYQDDKWNGSRGNSGCANTSEYREIDD